MYLRALQPGVTCQLNHYILVNIKLNHKLKTNLCPLDGTKGRSLWPILQPITRGQLTCFGFSSEELSRHPSLDKTNRFHSEKGHLPNRSIRFWILNSGDLSTQLTSAPVLCLWCANTNNYMLTNASDDWWQGFLYCFFVTVANFPYRERKS